MHKQVIRRCIPAAVSALILLSQAQPVCAAVNQFHSVNEAEKYVYSQMMKMNPDIEYSIAVKSGQNFDPDTYTSTSIKRLYKLDSGSGSVLGDYASCSLYDGDTISVIKFPENGKDVYYFEDKINYTTTKQEQKTYEKKKKELLSSLKLKKGTSEYARYQNVSKIYKWITSNVSYDNTSKMNTAYDALINRCSTCQGYSALFYDLCRSSNIPCRILIGKTIQGKAKGLHEWNMVKFGKKWYQVDSTWDASNGFNQQFYFLRGSSFFSSDHTLWKRYQTKQFKKNFPLAKTDYKPKGKLK